MASVRAAPRRATLKQVSAPGSSADRAWSTMVSDEVLGTLLDELATSGHRDAQLRILRDWIGKLLKSWDAQSSEEQRETLGKLGGG